MTVVAERRQESDGARSPKRLEEGVRVCAPKQAQTETQTTLPRWSGEDRVGTVEKMLDGLCLGAQ